MEKETGLDIPQAPELLMFLYCWNHSGTTLNCYLCPAGSRPGADMESWCCSLSSLGSLKVLPTGSEQPGLGDTPWPCCRELLSSFPHPHIPKIPFCGFWAAPLEAGFGKILLLVGWGSPKLGTNQEQQQGELRTGGFNPDAAWQMNTGAGQRAVPLIFTSFH